MELLHPAMWHDHDIDFARWLYPTMWHVALESWQWIHQVAACCNVTRCSGIMTLNSPGGSTCNVAGGSMTCHGIRRNVRHIAKFYLNRTTLGRKKWRRVDFQDGEISAILDFRGPIMGSLKSPCTTSYKLSIDTIALNCLVFERIAFLHFGVKRWRISAILDFRDWVLWKAHVRLPIGRQYRS